MIRMYSNDIGWQKYLRTTYWQQKALPWLLHTRSQSRIITTLALALIALACWQTAKTFWQIALPAKAHISTSIPQSAAQVVAAKQQQPDYQALSNMDWFGLPPELQLAELEMQEVEQETTLNLTLNGTILGQWPRAVIKNNETGKTLVLEKGEEFINGITLQGIERRRVVLNNKGNLEQLSLPAAMGLKVEKTGGSEKPLIKPTGLKKAEGYTLLYERPVKKRLKVEISKQDVTNALANLGALANEGQFIPRVASGKTEGYKVLRIKNNSFLRQLGIKEGDVILKLDGIHVFEREKLFPLLMNMGQASSAELLIHRHGENVLLHISAS